MPRIPNFVYLLIVFVIWLRIASKRTSRLSQKDTDVFWQKELKSNFVRKKDISNLEFLSIPIDRLPFNDTSDEQLIDAQNQVKSLSEKKILNLTGITNTDLKLKYGMGNLDKLSEYDYNFTLLTRVLYSWSNRLYELNNINDAKTVLEFGISCNVDMMKHYMLLTNIYVNENNTIGIDNLINKASTLNSLLKPSIIKYLETERSKLQNPSII